MRSLVYFTQSVVDVLEDQVQILSLDVLVQHGYQMRVARAGLKNITSRAASSDIRLCTSHPTLRNTQLALSHTQLHTDNHVISLSPSPWSSLSYSSLSPSLCVDVLEDQVQILSLDVLVQQGYHMRVARNGYKPIVNLS